MPWRSVIATVMILVVGYTSFTLGTDNWTIWTAETARRQAVLERPMPLPNYRLNDSTGSLLSLSTFDRPLAVVDFIYTECLTVCLAMGAQFRLLQSELANAGLLNEVQLLSITFDPTNDDQAALAGYLSRFGALEPHWRAARFEQDMELEGTLADLGVVVLPEPRIGFVHNAAFYLIENGRVIAIFDVENRAGLLEAIENRTAS